MYPMQSLLLMPHAVPKLSEIRCFCVHIVSELFNHNLKFFILIVQIDIHVSDVDAEILKTIPETSHMAFRQKESL